MKQFLRNNAIVLFTYLVLVVIAIIFIIQYPKDQVHLYVNSFVGNPYADAFFYYITYLGDGNVALFLLLVIVVFNVRKGIYATFSFLTAALLCTVLKYVFFDDVNRPHFHFQYINKVAVNIVEGVDLHIHNSFPSGHATQAFAIFIPLAFTSRNPLIKLLCLAGAVCTGFSRVYLSQHWLIDITAGSILGFATAILFYSFSQKSKKLMDWNQSLPSLISAKAGK